MNPNRTAIDPHVARLITESDGMLSAISQSSPPEQIRESAAQFHVWMRGPIDGHLSDIPAADGSVGGVPVRWYGPRPTQDRDIILFIHGGGWLAGDIDSYDPDVRLMQQLTGATVVAVDYRRTPEHQFPAPVEDCVTVLEEVARAPHRGLAIAGDSAGGNLAIGATVLTRGRVDVDAVLALYPVVDPNALGNQSYTENGSGYLLTAEQLELYWNLYAPTSEARLHPAAAALTGELRGFPATILVTADYDPLRDEGRQLAARLVEADVPVTYLPNPGLTHGFQQMVPRIPAATRALQEAYGALTLALSKKSASRLPHVTA